jgi:large subunit ribosomal protein L31
MKDGIHPNYVESTITCSSCNSEVHTHATVPNIRVDLCSNCHPFYTGKQRIVDTAGRVERFNQRRTAGDKAQKAAARKAGTATRTRTKPASPAG